MALNPDAVGKKTPDQVLDYTWKDTVLYALGVGARADELDYLYEGRGPKVLPTYAVVPGFPTIYKLFEHTGGDMMGVVHGGQRIEIHKPFAPRGKLITVGTVAGIWDLTRMGTALLTTETRDGDGELLATTEWTIIFRNDGDFGGEAPPKQDKIVPPDRVADFRVEEKTGDEQALLYRLNGDFNPLHADPAIGEKVGFGRAILHGLCTYGYVGRAVLKECCGGDTTKLKSLTGQFRKPVWPGDTIITEGWNEDGRIVLRASTLEHPEDYAFSNAYAEVTP